MDLEQLTALGIGAEQARKVIAAIDREYMPKEYFEDIEAQNRELEAEAGAKEAELRNIKFDNAINDFLRKNKAKNPKAVKALLKLDNAEIGENGEITGIAEQLEALMESDGYLFETGRKYSDAGGRMNPPRSRIPSRANPWAKDGWNLTEQSKMLKNNPSLAEQLKAKAGR